MPQALQMRRGYKNVLPAKAALGEPLIATDTREIFIGQGITASDGNVYKLSDVVFGAIAPTVEKEKIWVNTTTNELKRASDDGTAWISLVGSGGGGSSTVGADFQVYGVTQGTYSDGATIAAGTSLEDVVKNMLQAVIPASYSAPTLGISSGQTVEAGTSITPTITPTWNQRDGGTSILYSLKKGGVDIFTNATAIAHADSVFILGDETVSYQATNTYNAGPIKNNNQGNPSPTGQIAAGTATSNVASYTGKRNLFYGINQSDPRALTALLGPVNSTTFTINIPSGATSVKFAYPDSLRAVSSVKYVELGNGEVKDTFTLTTELIAGAAGFTSINYKVYTYIPAIPFGDAVTYSVTI